MTEFTDERTLYQRVGGEAAVRAAVGLLYERVLADASLSGFITGANMPRPKAHQFCLSITGARRSEAIQRRLHEGSACQTGNRAASLRFRWRTLKYS